jgi:DnaJ-class molecular chaperone
MEDKIKKHYKLLDLEAGASIENVKRAFKELSQIWHPDIH